MLEHYEFGQVWLASDRAHESRSHFHHAGLPAVRGFLEEKIPVAERDE